MAKIKLKRFTYPNGSETWRVSGSVDGKQYRKNFKDRTKALECKQELEVKQLNGPELGRHMWVKITPEEHDDAFTALRLLKEAKSPRNLTFAVQHLLETFKEVDTTVALQVAKSAYIEARLSDVSQRTLEKTSFDSISHKMDQFEAAVGADMPLGHITAETIEGYLKNLSGGSPSMKTWNNVRGILNHFFGWCVREKYTEENPVDDIRTFRINRSRSTAKTLSTAQVEDLMAWAEENPGPTKYFKTDHRRGMFVPYLALNVFGGIRPSVKDGEIIKLQEAHIDLRTGVIRVEPSVSKTNELRKVQIQPNLAAWLDKYPIGDYPIFRTGDSFKRELNALRKRFKIPHDGLRHTYVSMLVGSFRSVGDAALQSGNSENVIKRHYLDLKSTEEADAFWRIVPAGYSLPNLIKVREEGKFIRADDQEKYLGVI